MSYKAETKYLLASEFPLVDNPMLDGTTNCFVTLRKP